MEAQEKDDITKSFIALVNDNKLPLYHETKSRGQYAIALREIFKDLRVQNDKLYAKTSDEAGDIILTLIVPPQYSLYLIKQIHTDNMHTQIWRLLRQISERYHVFNLKQVARIAQNQCLNCKLGSVPAIRQSKRRKVRTLHSIVGHTCAADLLMMPPSKNRRYILSITDTATAFVAAAALPYKDSICVSEAFKKLMLQQHTIFKCCITDTGSEFRSAAFQSAATELNINHIMVSEAAKNQAASIESCNMRLLNLLRKSLDSDKEHWPDMLDKVVYSLNASSFLYAKSGTIATPAYLQHARHPVIPKYPITDDSMVEREASIKSLMRQISKERNLENPALHIQIEARQERYRPGEIVYCLQEWVLARRKHKEFLLSKIRKFWQRCKVIAVLPQNMYLVMAEGETETRRVHKKITKPINQHYQQNNLPEAMAPQREKAEMEVESGMSEVDAKGEDDDTSKDMAGLA